MWVRLSSRMFQAAHISLSKAIATRRHSAQPSSSKLTETLALDTLNPKPEAQTLNRSEDYSRRCRPKEPVGGGSAMPEGCQKGHINPAVGPGALEELRA